MQTRGPKLQFTLLNINLVSWINERILNRSFLELFSPSPIFLFSVSQPFVLVFTFNYPIPNNYSCFDLTWLQWWFEGRPPPPPSGSPDTLYSPPLMALRLRASLALSLACTPPLLLDQLFIRAIYLTFFIAVLSDTTGFLHHRLAFIQLLPILPR